MNYPFSGECYRKIPTKGGIYNIDTITGVGLLIVTITLIIFYSAAPKHLSVFQIIFSWMMIVFLDDAYFTIFSLNLKLIGISDRMDHLWLRVLSLYVLSPIVVIWTMDGMRLMRKWLGKMLLFALGTALLLGDDAALNFIGVWSFPSHWPYVIWLLRPLLLISLVFLFTSAFRQLLIKEGFSN